MNEVYLCFNDYTKIFDYERHREIIIKLTHLKIDGRDLQVIKNIYWEQRAAMRVDGETNQTSSFLKIKRDVRQACMISTDRFSLYSEMIMRNLRYPGIKEGGHSVNSLRQIHSNVCPRHVHFDQLSFPKPVSPDLKCALTL